MTSPIMRWFDASHLEGELRDVADFIRTTAIKLDTGLPDCAEKTAGLRKLLEAKDCFIRASIQGREAPGASDPAPRMGQGYAYDHVGGLAHKHGKAEHAHEGGNSPHTHSEGKVVPL